MMAFVPGHIFKPRFLKAITTQLYESNLFISPDNTSSPKQDINVLDDLI